MTTTTDPTVLDVRDMIVVHTALLREIRIAPRAVARVADAPARLRARTARHVLLVLDVLEHHHAGEDRLLLPLLQARATRAQLRAVDTVEEQHARIEALITASRRGLEAWQAGGAEPIRAPIGDLHALHTALETHLHAEETEVLPLAAAYLTAAEWAAIGEAGFRSIPKPALALVFGMLMYEGDPAVLRGMLAEAPPPVRALMPRIAPRVYARRCRALLGTDRP